MAGSRYVVGAARCESYADVSEKLELAIERAGGLPSGAPSDVLVKANFLAPKPPEAAVTTHPEILRHAVRAARRAYGDIPVTIADNPGYILSIHMKQLFGVTGAAAIGEEERAEVGTLGDYAAIKRGEEGGKNFRILSTARVSRKYLGAGLVINAAKLKTHVETEMTACVKNIFGIADTNTRKSAHRAATPSEFADAMVDLFSIRTPDFNILDAVISMEGDGPTHGSPRATGWILAGENALAVDYCAAVIVGYHEPRKVPFIAAASERGMGPADLGEVELVGATLEELAPTRERPYKKASTSARFLPTFLRDLAYSIIAPSPELSKPKCVRCAICEKVCPVDAISMEGANGYPAIERKKCVRCLCCHEMCPTGAMGVRRNAIARLLCGD